MLRRAWKRQRPFLDKFCYPVAAEAAGGRRQLPARPFRRLPGDRGARCGSASEVAGDAIRSAVSTTEAGGANRSSLSKAEATAAGLSVPPPPNPCAAARQPRAAAAGMTTTVAALPNAASAAAVRRSHGGGAVTPTPGESGRLPTFKVGNSSSSGGREAGRLPPLLPTPAPPPLTGVPKECGRCRRRLHPTPRTSRAAPAGRPAAGARASNTTAVGRGVGEDHRGVDGEPAAGEGQQKEDNGLIPRTAGTAAMVVPREEPEQGNCGEEGGRAQEREGGIDCKAGNWQDRRDHGSPRTALVSGGRRLTPAHSDSPPAGAASAHGARKRSSAGFHHVAIAESAANGGRPLRELALQPPRLLDLPALGCNGLSSAGRRHARTAWRRRRGQQATVTAGVVRGAASALAAAACGVAISPGPFLSAGPPYHLSPPDPMSRQAPSRCPRLCSCLRRRLLRPSHAVAHHGDGLCPIWTFGAGDDQYGVWESTTE